MISRASDFIVQVEDFLELSAARLPDKPALICGDRRLTYRELDEQCNRLAAALLQLGVVRGDRVAVCLNNSVESVISIFAILKSGAIFTVLSSAASSSHLFAILGNSGAKVLVTDSRRLALVQTGWDDLPDLKTVVVVGSPQGPANIEGKSIATWEDVLSNPGPNPQGRPKGIDVDVAALIYTSGSTGVPKGVVLTHGNMVAAASSVTEYLENAQEDILMNVLPLASSYGLYQVLTAFKIGGSVVLEESFTYPYAVLKKMADERVTGLAIVPTIAAILLQMNLSGYQLPHLRYITNAGAALPTAHVRKLRRLFPRARLYLMYGLTECKRVSYLSPEEVDRRPNSVGKPMRNVDAYIVDEQGGRLPPGEVGELVVRGANVMKGYWGRPEETARVLKPGVFPGEQILHTGDLFRVDAEGYLYWFGRNDDIIKCRAEKVSPKDIEDVLHTLEEVAVAVVVGVPDEMLGQAIKAVITLKEGANLTRNDVLRHCSRRLENHMLPTVIEFRETLPQTPTGKTDRRELLQGMKVTEV